MFKPINSILYRVKVLSSWAANKVKEIGANKKNRSSHLDVFWKIGFLLK